MFFKIKSNEKLFQFLKFALVGGVATVIHYSIYLFLENSFHLSYNSAYTFGYLLSFIFNYFSSNFFTFNTKPSTSNGIKFAGAHLMNYFIHIGLLNLFIFIGISKVISPIFVFPIAIIINFFMVRYALKKN